jgi:hypothetical protein
VRRREPAGGIRHELMDAKTWPRCERFGGGTQPCLCWFADRQWELYEADKWPRGEVGLFSDYLETT